MRTYRPKPVQNFFNDLEQNSIKFEDLDLEELILLYQILDQVHCFRNSHWMFVQKYIMVNTKYNVATGGTPITTWIPNQIEAVLKYMRLILEKISDNDFVNDKKVDWNYKYKV